MYKQWWWHKAEMSLLTLSVVVCGLAVTAAQEISIDLQTGLTSGSPVTPANGFEWEYQPPSSTCHRSCDLQGVLKLTFNSTRKHLKIHLTFSSIIRGVPFHIVELDKNESCVANLSSKMPLNSSLDISLMDMLRSCANTSLKMSEVLLYEKNMSIYSEDKSSNETKFEKSYNESKQMLLHFEPEYLGYDMSLSIRDKEFMAENGTKLLLLKSEKLFNISSPSLLYPEYVLYLGMNSRVDDPMSVGEGLCSARISWYPE